MVPGLSSESASESAAERRNLQYELEGPGQSGRSWEATCRGLQIAKHGQVDQLLDVSPLTDDMSDHANDKQSRIVQPAQNRQAERGHEHDDEDRPEDLTVRESQLDLAAVREKL